MASSDVVTSTDYRHPFRPIPVRLFNGAFRLVGDIGPARPIEVEALLRAAEKETGFSDFGDPSFREPLAILVESMEREAKLNPVGRAIMRGRLESMLANRLRIEALLRGVQPSLRRYLSGLAGTADADDLLQDVLVIVVRRLGTLDDRDDHRDEAGFEPSHRFHPWDLAPNQG